MWIISTVCKNKNTTHALYQKTQKIVERHPIKIMPIKNLCKERLTPRRLITNPFILIRSTSFCCSYWSFYRMVMGTFTWSSLSHFTRSASSRETQFPDGWEGHRLGKPLKEVQVWTTTLTTSLGERHPPCVCISISFSLFLSLLYSLKRYITKKQNKNLSLC